MVAQFPSAGASPSSVGDSLLIPTLDILVNITDVGTSEAAPNPDGNNVSNSINRHSRVVEITIKATGIQVALIKSAIERIFIYATHAINDDMNIKSAADKGLPLNPYAIPTHNPKVNITIDVNRSKRDKTVDLAIAISNLESSFVTATFNRVSAYINDAVTIDLNPSI